ncbi:mycothiol transferase [Micromonospora marina]|uniref:mycothiol transferase n=1 Tax=Micromonospora marina TaxID=307120 RepID=UPI003F4F6009
MTCDRRLREGIPAPRPASEPDPDGTDMWAREHETREEVIGRYRRASEHADATIDALPVDAPGHVPWWPRPDVKLFNILVHVVAETNRHAGHADILREQLDGSTGAWAEYAHLEPDQPTLTARRVMIERAARAAADARRLTVPTGGSPCRSRSSRG